MALRVLKVKNLDYRGAGTGPRFFYVIKDSGGSEHGEYYSKKEATAALKRRFPDNRKNPATRKRPKLGQWVKAARVRLVKRNGATHVEIQRTIAKKKKTATKKSGAKK